MWTLMKNQYSIYFQSSNSSHLLYQVLFSCVLALLFCLPSIPLYAQSPTIFYDESTKTIFVGNDEDAKPYSQSVQLSEVVTALPDGVLMNQDGVWLSKASIIVRSTAKLEIRQGDGVSELHFESILGNITFIRISDGSHLLLENVKVMGWDTANNRPDEEVNDGRAYIVVENGSQLDVVASELAYLGGVSSTSNTDGIVVTGSNATIQNSKLHHNYEGLYVSNGLTITVTNNESYQNLNNGLHFRSGTNAATVENNNVRNNGSDGILFDANSIGNIIRNNTVISNTGNGIVVKRQSNNNMVVGNTVSQNTGGIKIDDADNNLVQGNTIKNNKNGIRMSGSLSNPAANNQLIGNLIEDTSSSQQDAYGIYLDSHADSNLIRNNQVLRSATYGIYIKAGGNRLEGNIINDGKTGIAIVGREESIGQIPLLFLPGSVNTVISSTIQGNTDIGIRIEGGVGNGIGAEASTGTVLARNIVQNNGGNGIFIKNTSTGYSSTDNYVVGNQVHKNGGAGIVVKDTGSDRNRLSRNSVTENDGSGIKVDGGAQAGIEPPVIENVLADGLVLGTAAANATIEVYSDPGSEGERLLGTTSTDGTGVWSFQLPGGQDSKQVTAIVIDSNGNTSAFSGVSGSAVELFTTVDIDEQNQTVINVNGPEAIATLADIQTLLGIANADLLQNQGNGVWQLNANLKLERQVTLKISPDTGVNELKLRSNAGIVTGTVDYSSFVYIRTHNGVIDIDSVKIYGWDDINATFDTNIADGRAYIIAKYGAELNISNAELSYLGTNDSTESYGVTWRDDTTTNAAGVVRTAVTGNITNSKFHHNFVGAQVIQAGDMTFSTNEFYNNNQYGFYARDASRDITLEGNLVYDNVSHGVMLRGISRFTLRNNKTYNNGNGGGGHGIVVSQDSSSGVASADNLLQGNESYGNGGNGISLEGGRNNELSSNSTYNNEVGINLKDASTANNVHANIATANTKHGFQLQQTADSNTFANNVSMENMDYGFYIRSNNNIVENNRASGNLKVGIALSPEDAIALQDNQLISNTVESNAQFGIDIRGSNNTKVQRNRVVGNGQHGVYIRDGAQNSLLQNNTIALNNDTGIVVSGPLSYQNRWLNNAIYGNQNMGIDIKDDANDNVSRPKITEIDGRSVKGQVNEPNATIEIFTDNATQGRYFVGRGVANRDGDFNVVISGSFIALGAVAIATDAQGNSSEFSNTFIVPELNPVYISFLPIVAR